MTDKLKAVCAWVEGHALLAAVAGLLLAGLLASVCTTLDAIDKANGALAWHHKADSMAAVIRTHVEREAAMQDTIDAQRARQSTIEAQHQATGDSLVRRAEEYADSLDGLSGGDLAAAAQDALPSPLHVGPLPQVCVTPDSGGVHLIRQLVQQVKDDQADLAAERALFAQEHGAKLQADSARDAAIAAKDAADQRIAQLEKPPGRLRATWDAIKGPLLFVAGVYVGAKVTH